ncbi:hypothetical protein ACQ4M3_25560 [Leptolyngbya sp. AN03gr2]|uniref:hypothetical protein n=1 Tax=unclassified Leptolyngbya TaxID=2650499 RepID=UPI003D31E0A6
MIIYVQSRGRSQEHDYRWLEVRKSSQSPSIPPLLKDLKVEELIESQKPSIILARSGKYLLLLVTALESREERSDFMRRQIRNSVAWVSEEKPEIEQLFRAITVRALRGELAADIDKAIGIGGQYGFEVDFEQLRHLVDHLEVGVKPATSAYFKYGKNNIELRADLALELSQFSLPHDLDNQILVVVTTLKSQEALERFQVWRGLSNRIESQTWVEVSTSASNRTELGSQKKTLLLGILVAVIVVAIGWMIWSSTLNSVPQNSPPRSGTSSQPPSATSLSKVPTTSHSPSTLP